MPDPEIRIKMTHTIRGEHPLSPPGTILRAGYEYPAKTNKNGAVSGLCNNGEYLGVKPGEFQILEGPEWLRHLHTALNERGDIDRWH